MLPDREQINMLGCQFQEKLCLLFSQTWKMEVSMYWLCPRTRWVCLNAPKSMGKYLWNYFCLIVTIFISSFFILCVIISIV